MKHPLRKIPIILTVGLLSVGTALAGSFTTDFSSTLGVTLGGNGTYYAFIETNRAILTPAVNSLGGSITIWDSLMDNGQPIESFTAAFKLQIGPGSGNAADGTSFNFGPNVTDGAVYSEEGPNGACVTVAFDIYDNGLGAEGHPTPSLDIRYQGQTVATHAFAKADMVTSQLEDVYITLNKSGAVSVSYKGQVIFTNVLVEGWAPTAGLFNISARTGGENAYQAVANLTINTVLQGTAVATTVTDNPADVTVQESATSSASFSVNVDGSAPFTFQWMRNGADILDATHKVLNLSPVHYSDNNAKFKCRVSNAVNTVTSTEATLTVIQDTTKPTVVKAAATTTGSQVIVTFSEPVTDTALTPSNYAIDKGVGVLAVTRLDASRVALTTTAMAEGQSFTLTINGVTDTASSPPNSIAANTQVTFRTVMFQLGTVLHKKYLNFPDNLGYDPNNLFNDPRYPNSPDRQDLMPMWEYPA
ncbi:MAG TPA: hypothetical protein VJA21_16320, partial [Verrucomicrobiae bacterium]